MPGVEALSVDSIIAPCRPPPCCRTHGAVGGINFAPLSAAGSCTHPPVRHGSFAWSGLSRGAVCVVLLACVAAPKSVEQRGDAVAPSIGLVLCERPRASVRVVPRDKSAAYGSLPRASLKASGPQTPGRLAFVSAWLWVLGGTITFLIAERSDACRSELDGVA